MTDVDSMPAGREMDAMVAERVMGWKLNMGGRVVRPDGSSFKGPVEDRWLDPNPHYQQYSLAPYSTDIAAAWKVVEKMLELDFHCVLGARSRSAYACYFTKDPHAKTETDYTSSAPLAICRAALKAVSHD